MSYVHKGRRTKYDNIAVGAAITSRERTIAGEAASTVNTTAGNNENIQVGTDYGEELVIVQATTLLEGENIG